MELTNSNKIHIAKTFNNGFGVFAKVAFKKGDIIERAIMMPLVNVDGNENPHLHTWSDDRRIWATGTGYVSLYNHSDLPNVIKDGDIVNDTMTVIAKRDIEAGEELCSFYMSKPWRLCFQHF